MLRPFFLLFATLCLGSVSIAQPKATVYRNDRIFERDDPQPLRPDWAPFYHGVASGDPLTDRVVIWTRVTPQDPLTLTLEGTWHVATDTAFQQIVRHGTFSTGPERDYTVKVDVDGLVPATTYYYGFTAFDKNSLTGRTRTAPDQSEHLRFAVTSCSNYQAGYFNAYRRMAERADLDAVIHLGDYIYEYGNREFGSLPEERPLQPEHEIVTLADYRTRYATYRLDTNLIRAHQQHPFITVWDDHESADDAYKDGAQNHNPSLEGPWETRKANAKQAYFEWMPVREHEAQEVYRALRYGDLVDLIMLDTRLTGREQQIRDPFDPALQDPERSLLGDDQRAWLLERLRGSTARWKVIGQQVILAPVEFGWGAFLDDDPNTDYRQAQGLAQDVWNGYPAERQTLLDFIQEESIQNVVILTGDFHTTFAFDVSPEPFDTVFSIDPQLGPVPFYGPSESYDPATGAGSLAVEFATPSLTSANFDENFGPALTLAFELLINQPLSDLPGIPDLGHPNPHMKYVNLADHGYFVLDLQPERVQADWYFSEILDPAAGERFGEGWRARHQSPHLQPASGATAAKPDPPILAPHDPPRQPITSTRSPDAVEAFTLLSVYPNPFRTNLVLNYALQAREHLRIDLVDASGQMVHPLLDQTLPPGLYSLDIEGRDLPAGPYVLQVSLQGQRLAFPVIHHP